MKIEGRTLSFINALKTLRERHKMPANKALAKTLGIKSVSTISEIKAQRQNIQPEAWGKFMKHYISEFPEFEKQLKNRDAYKLIEISNGSKVNEDQPNYAMNLFECRQIVVSQQETIYKLSTSIENLTSYLGGNEKKKLP